MNSFQREKEVAVERTKGKESSLILYSVSKLEGSAEMGSQVSSFQEAKVTSDSIKSNKSQIITFHSSAKWKIHFESSKESSKLMVIDFTASWCGPCRFMEPALNEFSAKYTDVEFIKIDVDELDDVAREFGVQAMPTFMLIKKGKEVDKVVGANKDELQQKIEKHRAI